MTEPGPEDAPPKGWTRRQIVDELAQEKIVIDHPLFRKAPAVSMIVGIAAALAVFLFAETQWWMPILVFGVVAAVLFRFLRPRFRHPSIEDEI